MTSTTAVHRTESRGWWVQVLLLALVLIPIVAGTSRLVELSGGPVVLPRNPRVDASPLPVVVHIVSAIGYAVLGAFQFSSGLRRRHPGWHRSAGRVLVVLGLAVALSALWMTQFYGQPEHTGDLEREGPPAGRQPARRTHRRRRDW